MIELVIGGKVRAVTPPINVYEIVTTGMSGDGDHYEKKSQFGGFDSTIKYLEYLNAVSAMGWNPRCGNDSGIDEVISEKAIELGDDPDTMMEWYYSMVGSDITNEGSMAMLTGVEVFWYDAAGVKHNVEVKGLIDPR